MHSLFVSDLLVVSEVVFLSVYMAFCLLADKDRNIASSNFGSFSSSLFSLFASFVIFLYSQLNVHTILCYHLCFGGVLHLSDFHKYLLEQLKQGQVPFMEMSLVKGFS